MPSLFTFDRTGPMMNRLRNSDSPASTWFGGTDWSPSALRVSESTTKILVKLVTSNSSDGAIVMTVSSSSRVSDWLGLLPPTLTVTDPAPPLGVLGPFGPFGAVADVGASLVTGVVGAVVVTV